jgi:hypothetical protein
MLVVVKKGSGIRVSLETSLNTREKTSSKTRGLGKLALFRRYILL